MAMMNKKSNEKPMTMRQMNAQLTKEKIYTAAIELIKCNGYANVYIQDITEAAGVAKGSFYTHFNSKEEILKYTFTHSDHIYQRVYDSLPVDGDFYTLLTLFTERAYIELENRGKELIKAIVSNYLAEELQGMYTDESRNLYKYLTMILKKGLDSGDLDSSVSIDIYVHIIITAFCGVETFWCLKDDDTQLSATATRMIKTLALGMIARNK